MNMDGAIPFRRVVRELVQLDSTKPPIKRAAVPFSSKDTVGVVTQRGLIPRS